MLLGHNFEILMNDPVDELAGAAEEVRRFSLYPFPLHANGLSAQTYNEIIQWPQGELAFGAQGRLRL